MFKLKRILRTKPWSKPTYEDRLMESEAECLKISDKRSIDKKITDGQREKKGKAESYNLLSEENSREK